MPEKKQNPIIRNEIFVVDHSEMNDYGDLIVTPKEDGGATTKTYKVGNKRSSLFGVFQPDMAVEVGYSEYMNREYIASARQVKDAIPNKPINLPEPVPPTVTSSIPKPEPKHAIAPQAIGMTTKEIGDMIRAKSLSVIFGQEMADKLVAWYKSQILQNIEIS